MNKKYFTFLFFALLRALPFSLDKRRLSSSILTTHSRIEPLPETDRYAANKGGLSAG